MIIAVSDVHLAEKADDWQVQEDDKKFADFLDYLASGPLKDGGELVLLGDIFDLWRRDFVNALIECESIVSRLIDLGRKANVHYVVGNHDYHMLRMCELFSDKYPFRVSKDLRLSITRESSPPDAIRDNGFSSSPGFIEIINSPSSKPFTV